MAVELLSLDGSEMILRRYRVKDVVLRVWSLDLWGYLNIFQKIYKGKNYFHNDTKILFAFFIVLTIALMMQKKWLVQIGLP